MANNTEKKPVKTSIPIPTFDPKTQSGSKSKPLTFKYLDGIEKEGAAVVKQKKTEKAVPWWELEAPKMTPELRLDLQFLRNRAFFDPTKHIPKTESKRPLPTNFQVGRVVEAPNEYYSARLTKKERKQTIVEEWTQDDKAVSFIDKKYHEIKKKAARKRAVEKRGNVKRQKRSHINKTKDDF